MKFSEIKQVLQAHDLRLTKSLGQNFMHDTNQLRRIVASAQLGPSTPVLEIGPGLGPLTKLLVQKSDQVLALEKDARLLPLLRQHLGCPSNLTVLHTDALSYLRQHHTHDWTAWTVVSNLPYSVASPTLVECAQLPNPPTRIVATVQWEVAQRLKAVPNSKDFGLLTLLTQARYRLTETFKIPASCFYPEPEVDSACVKLEHREPELLDYNELAPFTQLVRLAFSQRRKTLWKLLRKEWAADRLERAFATLGLSAQARAESVSLSNFIALMRILQDGHG